MENIIFAVLFAILPPCPTEDSVKCKWDATIQGNGKGKSFIAVNEETYLYQPEQE